AMLRMPSENVPVGAGRTVDILRRLVASTPTPRAMFAYFPPVKAPELRKAIKGAGFETEAAANVKDAFQILHQSADFDVLFLHEAAGRPELDRALTQLRTDHDHRQLPLFIVVAKTNDRLDALAAKHRHVRVVSEAEMLRPEFKDTIDAAVRESAGTRLSP